MPCDYPLRAFRGFDKVTGKPVVVFKSNLAINPDNPLSLPCGTCMGCRIERARQWAVRCMHEAQMWAENSFVTLTFDNEHLPDDYGVHVRDLQLFFKKLRKLLHPKRIRFFACGEYGDENLRPHYHALIFNHEFPQKTFWSERNGKKQYRSPQLDALWPQGLATFGDVEYQSARYVAEYSNKKIGGDKATDHYTRIHPITHKISVVSPEFAVMSRRPGIGQLWFQRFSSDVFPSDNIIVDGRKQSSTRYYDQQLTEEQLKEVKQRRKAQSLPHKHEQTPERRKARIVNRAARMALFNKRKL